MHEEKINRSKTFFCSMSIRTHVTMLTLNRKKNPLLRYFDNGWVCERRVPMKVAEGNVE